MCVDDPCETGRKGVTSLNETTKGLSQSEVRLTGYTGDSVYNSGYKSDVPVNGGVETLRLHERFSSGSSSVVRTRPNKPDRDSTGEMGATSPPPGP